MRPAALLVAAALVSACGPGGARSGFVDVAAAMGVRQATWSGSPDKAQIRETLGQGVCVLDADGDGQMDLFVPNGARRMPVAGDSPPVEAWQLYIREGGRFVDRAAEAGLRVAAWGIGCAVGDVDGDGRDDLLVTTADGHRLFHNEGGTRFVDWSARIASEPRLSASAAFVDVEADGDLDVFVTRYLDERRPPPPPCTWKGTPVMCGPKGFPPLDALLYINDGHGQFVERSRAAGLAGHPGFGLGVVTLDADGDFRSDLFVANDSSPRHLFLNRGDGTFAERGFVSGVALSENGASQASMGVDAGDVDGDGRQDLVVTNFSDDTNNLFHGEPDGQFSEWASRSGLAAASFSQLGWAALLEDMDLDGDLDLFVANSHVFPQVDEHDPNTRYRQKCQLLFNDGQGRFREEPARLGPDFNRPVLARGAAAVDLDEDGDMDLVVTRDGEPPLVFRNDLPAPGAHSLAVRLRGRAGGLGAVVTVEASGRRQVREFRRARGYLSSSEPVLRFGLGASRRVERITVRWPGGAVQTHGEVEADRDLTLAEESRDGTP